VILGKWIEFLSHKNHLRMKIFIVTTRKRIAAAIFGG